MNLLPATIFSARAVITSSVLIESPYHDKMSEVTSDTGPRLPVELLHATLQFVNKPTLSACTLVSHDWLHISRIHLFKSIIFRMHPDNHYKTHDGGPVDNVPLPLQDLATFLESSPSVCKYIKHLILTLPRSRPQGGWQYKERYVMSGRADHLNLDMEFCRIQTLIEIVGRLTNLSKLEISGIPFHTPEPPFDARPVVEVPIVKRLAELKITRWWQAGGPWHGANLIHLLSLFEEIDHLALGSYQLKPKANASLVANVQLRIHSISFESTEALVAIRDLPDIDKISKLAIPCLYPGKIQDVSTLTNRARPNLRHVALKLNREIYHPPEHNFSYVSALNIATLENLESLTVTISVYDVVRNADSKPVPDPDSAGFYEPAYNQLTRLLAALPRTLTKISFIFSYLSTDPYYVHFPTGVPSPDVPLQRDWSVLDSILAKRVAVGLKSIELEDGYRQCFPVAEQTHIQRALPRIWRTGITRFSQASRPL